MSPVLKINIRAWPQHLCSSRRPLFCGNIRLHWHHNRFIKLINSTGFSAFRFQPSPPPPLLKVIFWNPSSIFWTPYSLWPLFLLLLSVYSQIHFLNIHFFQMENFKWLLKTNLMKTVALLVKCFSDKMVAEIFQIYFSEFWMWLMVKAHSFCYVFDFQPQGLCPGCFLCLECSSLCSLNGWLCSLLKAPAMSERISLRDLFKVLTPHPQSLFIPFLCFIFFRVTLKCLWSEELANFMRASVLLCFFLYWTSMSQDLE